MPDLDMLGPLQTAGLADYHCHCDYSIDAVGSIDEYCQAALKKGLVEICFTTHWDTSPISGSNDNVIRIKGKLKPTIPDNLEPYVEDVRRANEKFFPLGLRVKLGLEYGWYPGCEETAIALKERYDFDHFLCGLHELDGLCFSCKECYPRCFAKYSVEELVEKYAEEIAAAASTGLFDCIAHLDYIRKYAHAHYGEELDRLLFERGLPQILEALLTSGTSLEINTGALRRGFSDYFPSMKIINAVKRAGVMIPFLGSDAHAPNEVGHDFDAAEIIASPWSEAWSQD
ncbi:MAG: histidinol-phosphatase HisJ family protein [candidate division Zixibacteria bacterium]|nr:histidinol-phosphatase HisJ family protein [candidate division Zixibacteria bacterium]